MWELFKPSYCNIWSIAVEIIIFHFLFLPLIPNFLLLNNNFMIIFIIILIFY